MPNFRGWGVQVQVFTVCVVVVEILPSVATTSLSMVGLNATFIIAPRRATVEEGIWSKL